MTSCPGCGAPYETPCGYCGARRTVAELQSERIARHWSDELKRLYSGDGLFEPQQGSPLYPAGMRERAAQQSMMAEDELRRLHARQYALMQAQTMEAPSVGGCIGSAFGLLFGGIR